jgi:NAD(P)-dependent dehydrogenase (short-subunit alcohol dehydrogenase family)
MRGKVALVTGAGGEIGAATAVRLAELGARLCLVDEDEARLPAVAAAVRDAGGEASVHVGDITTAEGCRAAVAAAVAAFGRLDALCNIANAFFPRRAADMTPAEFERTLAVNMAAPFYLFQAAIPHLLESHGAVVSVSSAAGEMTTPNTAAYSASKAGLNHLTRVLAKEYMGAPVRINAVAPGAIAVDLTPKTPLPPGTDDPRAVQRSLTPRGLVPVAELAEMICFLASDAAEGFHGACIALDKGMSLG